MGQAQSRRVGVSISERFKPLYVSDKRYFILTGGRGSLKTSTVMDFVARLSYERGHVILYTRYTMDSAKETIIPLFQKVLERMGIESDFDSTINKVVNKRTGSYIYFSGIKSYSKDQTAKLKTLPDVTTWVIEEGEDFDNEKSFMDIDDSIRSIDVQNRIIWIQNPTTKEHFIYKKFIENTSRKIDVYGYDVTVSNHPQVEHIHTTYHLAEQLGYLSDSWLYNINEAKTKAEHAINDAPPQDRYRVKHSTKYYYKYIGGWLERAEGVVFDNWIEGEFDNTLPFCYAMDYGYSPDPLALVKIAVNQRAKKIHIKCYIYETEINDVGERLERVGVYRHELIVCDTNEPRTTANLLLTGFNIQPAIKQPGSVASDIRDIKEYTIVVDPDSQDVKTELNNYVWNDKKASIPIDAYNHTLDPMRYGFRRLTDGSAGIWVAN